MAKDVDINENQLLEAHKGVFRQLLYDHSTRKNIFWATDSYADLGIGYAPHDEITIEKITGGNGNVIIPRSVKAKVEQSKRTKDMAEVFTPSTVCKTMVDYIMPEPDVCAVSTSNSRGSEGGFTYLEITCGEAPFLVSRYDTVTGEPIPIDKRIGILDRLLRYVNATASDEDYARQSLLALGNVYGYEWQGDNLLLAREAVLTSFVEYYVRRFGSEPDETLLMKAAEIVSWNLWQMDGLKAVVPGTCHETTSSSLDLFAGEQSSSSPCPGCAKDDILLHNGIRCRLRRWIPKTTQNAAPSYGIDFFEFSFLDVINHKTKTHNKIKYTMNFDYIIGNPPYQDETIGDNKGFAPPVYDKFIDGAYQIGDKVELIHPARFLFNAGSTPKQWNRKMLNDPSLKILKYYSNASNVFPNVQLTGGIAITYHDSEKSFGAIEVFTAFDELNQILFRVTHAADFKSMESIVITRTIYRLSDKLHEDNPNAKAQLSNGHAYDMASNIFERLPQVFFTSKPNDGQKYLRIYGRKEGKRAYMYIRRDYVNTLRVPNVDKYKVVLAKADGAAGTIGKPIPARILGNPIIEEPEEGTTESFISIGSFDTKQEAENAMKYVKTKFLRSLLSVLKVTQEINPEKFKYVPLQDFTSSSDIDWSKSIHDIDLQLYAKYGLDAAETAFIEKMVKEME